MAVRHASIVGHDPNGRVPWPCAELLMPASGGEIYNTPTSTARAELAGETMQQTPIGRANILRRGLLTRRYPKRDT